MKSFASLIIPINSKSLYKNIIYSFLLVIFSLGIERILFFSMYYSESKTIEIFSFFDIVASFFVGLRFDFSVVPIFLFVYHVLLFFLFILYSLQKITFNNYKLYCLVLFFFEWFYFIHLLMSNFSSILNYGVNHKFLGWEYFAYFSDLPVFIKSVYSKNPFLLISIFVFIFVSLSLGIVLIFPSFSQFHNEKPIFKFSYLYVVLIYLVFSVILIRGGLQESPFRSADALTHKSNFINHLKLNGIFTIIHDFSDVKDFQIFFPVEENIKFTREFLKNQDPFISDFYPLLRYKKPKKILFPKFKTIDAATPERKYNIILILLESWSAKFLKINGYPEEVTPNLNQLILKGVFFKNFYASGGRSANGIFCILTGLPDRAGRTILRSNQIFNQFGSLPFLLKEKGYTTLFLHNGDLEFDNLKNSLPHFGFEILIGKEEMEKSKRYTKKWAMGFFDEDLYDMAYLMMNQIQEPFFMTIFTSNNHHPYTVPNSKFEIFPATDIEYKFKNSYFYADYALGEFIKRIEKSKFIKNTILILVADHTHHANLNYLEDRQIPFLIYSPYLFQNQIIEETSSQLDILPTILSLSGGNTIYSAIGRDLTSEEKLKSYHPFAFFAGGSNTDIIGMIYDPYIAYYYFHHKEKYLFRIDKEIDLINIAKENQQIALEMDYIIKNIYQFSRYLEKNNIVWPKKEKYLELKNAWIQ